MSRNTLSPGRAEIGAVIVLCAMALALLAAFGVPIVYFSTTGTETCSVVSKDRTSKSGGGSDMRIYTEDCGVLVVADSLFDGQWSSADVYQAINPGHRYTFHTRGFRYPFLSAFPTIVQAVQL